ncbi:DNA polymerase I [Desulfobulbus alkaliphilus]|uniref:DNA polymerase I n=1 Tax=Desulfobulbus alkaliphilus TaxID=869814 RepID=UPI001962C2C7|nr:DNA polymerase I [Desulfobulbus alkaliphilus]MBM9535965.1 DNA polymerase I [Desulfobulbus alkaliphilus]
MTEPEIYLIDGSAYIYRAYHAIRPLTNAHGLPTHAVYGFTTILRRLIRERQPRYLAVAYDSRGPVFRHQFYNAYKANRPPMPDDLAAQIPYIHKMVAAHRILHLQQDDQEADDLIASVTDKMVAKGCRVVIVSGDKDLLQLVNDRVSLWDPMNDRTMDQEAVQKKYGLDPAQLLDYFALTGDSSDNIPGVPGIGPKTAQKLISEYHSLEALYGAVEAMKPARIQGLLQQHRSMAFLSRDLVRLNHKAAVPGDIEQYRLETPDQTRLQPLLTELEFHSLLKEYEPVNKIDTSRFYLVQNRDDLAALGKRLCGLDVLAVDTETDSLDPRGAHLVGLSLGTKDGEAWYIPCGHRNENGTLVAAQPTLADLGEVLRPVLEDPDSIKVGHNLKFDLAVLAAPQNGGIRLNGPLHDTMVGAWLLAPDRRTYKLDDLCREFNLCLTTFAEVTGGDKRGDAFCRVELMAAKEYSCEDVFAALHLYHQQLPRLTELQLLPLLRDVEGPLIPVLAAMEYTGILVDADKLAALAAEFGERLEGFEQKIYQVAGETFNINSPKQLGELLFEKLGLPKGRKTKTGWSTDVKVLESLSLTHELPALILQYRNLAKLKSTYVDRLAELRDPLSSRIHTSFNQCGTATGRLSSSSPNLQNIPIRTEEGRRIRSAFIAAPGWQLLAADYSQIDLRVLAHYSQDQALLEAFLAGQDIHRRTAAEIFMVSPQLLTSEMRRVAKTINFGIVYGMSSFGLASQLHVSRKEAQTFIDRYFAHFSGIKEFMEKIVSQARKDGFVTTLLGRRRPLPDIASTNRVQREFAERMAINTPIQGTAADIIKLAMLRVHQELSRRQLQARLLLQIHDELVLEVPKQELDEVSTLLKTHMEGAMNLRVPLVVHLSQGQSLDKE